MSHAAAPPISARMSVSSRPSQNSSSRSGPRSRRTFISSLNLSRERCSPWLMRSKNPMLLPLCRKPSHSARCPPAQPTYRMSASRPELRRLAAKPTQPTCRADRPAAGRTHRTFDSGRSIPCCRALGIPSSRRTRIQRGQGRLQSVTGPVITHDLRFLAVSHLALFTPGSIHTDPKPWEESTRPPPESARHRVQHHRIFQRVALRDTFPIPRTSGRGRASD